MFDCGEGVREHEQSRAQIHNDDKMVATLDAARCDDVGELLSNTFICGDGGSDGFG
jgi:hypothetical protein